MPVATRVPQTRGVVPLGTVRTGREVSAREWGELALLMNYVRGRGAMLIPGHTPMVQVSSGSHTLRYRTQPSGRAIARIWLVEMLAGSSAPARAKLQAGSGAQITVSASSVTRLSDRYFVLTETAAKTSVVTELTLGVEWVAGDPIVAGVSCWELPRAQLTQDATDLGIDLGTLDPERPIVGTRAYESVRGVGASVAASDGRRCGLASWWGSEDVAFTSGSFESLFEDGIRIVPPRVGPTETAREVTWDVYAWADVGTKGAVRVIDAAGGVSAELGVDATPQWRGPGTKNFLCESAGAAGLPGGSYETINVQVRRTDGAGNVYLRGFNAWDGDW